MRGTTRCADANFGATLTIDETGHFEVLPRRRPLWPPGHVVHERYTILGLLGQGGMGSVYRVRDAVHLDRPTALKVMRGEGLSRAQISRFKAEFRIMSSLRHPNLAEVYDFEPLPGTGDHFYTMALVEGADLFEATRDTGLQAVLDAVVEVCRALSYVHGRDLVHFDLKPSNVLVDRTGRVRVLDFGTAGFGRGLEGWRIRGTPRFMAPELCGPNPWVDHRADLYSLGVMTYLLLCRRPPFQASTLLELRRLHRDAPLVFPDEVAVPEWLRAIVRRLCSKDPQARFPHANAVIEAINRRGGLGYALQTPATRESYLFASRFVGREAELEVVRAHVLQADSVPTASVIGLASRQDGHRPYRPVSPADVRVWSLS